MLDDELYLQPYAVIESPSHPHPGAHQEILQLNRLVYVAGAEVEHFLRQFHHEVIVGR
jgi:hypothetical protein